MPRPSRPSLLIPLPSPPPQVIGLNVEKYPTLQNSRTKFMAGTVLRVHKPAATPTTPDTPATMPMGSDLAARACTPTPSPG